MTREHFNSLTPPLEGAWPGRPAELLKHTVRWMLLGYVALVFAVLAGPLLLAAGVGLSIHFHGVAGTLMAGVVAFAGAALSCFVLACLWVKPEPPEGLAIEADDHPELFRLIREICGRAGCKHFHQVLLDPEMNACAVQNPRLGVFGLYRTYLVIGLPLMEILPLGEFKAVLAHEIAHLTRAGGRTGAWLHRTRAMWERIAERMTAGRFRPLLGGFFHWFLPRLNSRTYILLRFNELGADRFAADWVTPAVLASALKRLAIQSHRAETGFWEPLECRIEGSGELPSDVMEQFAGFLRTPPERDQARTWLAEALARTTDAGDSHPDLATRLAHLGPLAGDPGALPGDVPEDDTAANRLLASGVASRARREFSDDWLLEARELRDQLPAEDPGPDGDGTREAWERIAALSRLDGLEKVQPEVLSLLERKPSHSGALFLRGCHLAQKGDPEAVAFLERAATDPTLAGRAFETLAGVLAASGRQEELEMLKMRANRHEMELRAALAERHRVSPDDMFLPHDFSAWELAGLRKALTAEPAVRRAWLGARHTRHLSQWRHLVLVLDLRGPNARSLPLDVHRQLEDRLLDAWDCDAYVTILLNGEASRLILKVLRRCIPDCEVYVQK